MFLGDGLGFDTYAQFLLDKNQNLFQGNVGEIEKKKNFAVVTIDEDVIPDLDPFVTTIDNLIVILKEYSRLRSLGVDKIEIILDNDDLSISGNEIN